jgi:hypothetical protein
MDCGRVWTAIPTLRAKHEWFYAPKPLSPR